ncbi:MAG: hypothetical protein JNN15_07280 [Blastocatellia bacterium]|nr:hypothetical protein [Blastocatellia bacterium]
MQFRIFSGGRTTTILGEEVDSETARIKFGQRIQRCRGCFVAFYIKDLWIDEEIDYYCEECKNDSMIHFNVYSKDFDFSQLPSMQQDE